ncbi:MAG: DUF3253 domain-containing protein [Kiritimatiellae bacterium]|nr:DUF3253 domain-containing protein [Kiritimatiellia bacterium]MDW8457840.1 DUF3253 domain-containing protein [Verrucomicrobiota bacterium]
MTDLQTIPRCSVCALPLPRGSTSDVCSRRCAGRRADAEFVRRESARLEHEILKYLRSLPRGSTLCPGLLARRVLPSMEEPLTVLRPLLFRLQDRGRITLSQKGSAVPWWKIRGPFRVRAR